MDFPQDKHLSAFDWQLVDRLRHQPKFLALFGLNIGRQNAGLDAQAINLVERLHRNNRRTTHFGHDDRQRRAEEIGTRIFDMVNRWQGRELGIGFLDDIVEQEAILHAARQPAP